MRSDGILPDVPLHFNPILAVYLVVLPTLVFSVLAVLYGYRKLKCPALELIRGSRKIQKVKSDRKQNTDAPFLRELKQSTVRSRFSLVFFIWFGAFVYASCVVMSFSISEVAGSDMMAVLMAGIGVVLAITTLFLAVTTEVRGYVGGVKSF